MLRSLLLGKASFEQLWSSAASSAACLPRSLAAFQVQQGLHQQQYSAAAAAASDSTGTSGAQSSTSDTVHDFGVSEQQQQQHDLQVQQETTSDVLPQQQEQKQTQVAPLQRLQEPIVPTNIILKALKDWQGYPPSKAELYEQVKQEYAAVFPSLRQFKQHLQHLVRKKLVAAKPQTPAMLTAAREAGVAPSSIPQSQRMKGGKPRGGTRPAYVYEATAAGQRVDVCASGTPLEQAAIQQANSWTARKMPQYIQYLEAGQIPVTPDNVHLLAPDRGMQRFKEQQEQELKRQQRQQQRRQQQQPRQ